MNLGQQSRSLKSDWTTYLYMHVLAHKIIDFAQIGFSSRRNACWVNVTICSLIILHFTMSQASMPDLVPTIINIL